MLSILLLCTVAVSTTATATNQRDTRDWWTKDQGPKDATPPRTDVDATPAENTICGRLPAVCNGTYVERTLEFVDDQALTGTLPPELGKLDLTNIKLDNTKISGTVPVELSRISELTNLSIAWNRLSGTLPAELGNLSRLAELDLWGNRLSGTIPEAINDFSELESLTLGYNNISGTIPAELGNLSRLASLSLAGNNLSGTIPEAISTILALTELWLWGNRLSGTIPEAISNFLALTTLDLMDNSISGTLPVLDKLSQLSYFNAVNNRLSGTLPSLSELPLLTDFMLANNSFTYSTTTNKRCIFGNVNCEGVPPYGCSAFEGDWRESITDSNACVSCTVPYAIVLIGVGIVLMVGFCIIIRLAVQDRSSLKRWVSTATILINHAQTASIIASLRLEWPNSLIELASALRLEMPHASCLFNYSDRDIFDVHDVIPRFGAFALFATTAALMSLVAPLLAKSIASSCGHFASADTAELASSIVYAVVFSFSWRLVFKYAVYFSNALVVYSPEQALFTDRNLSGDWMSSSFPRTILLFAESLILALLLLALAVHFARNAFSFQRGVNKGEWRSPGLCRRGTVVAPRRLERQVAFLTGRFARYAPRWQLVIWLRQFLLLIIVLGVDLIFYRLSEEEFRLARYAGAAAAIAVTLAFWLAHRSTAPFAFDFQNALESWLYGATTVLLVLTCIYTALAPATSELGVSRTVVELLMAAVFPGSLLGGALLSLRELRRTRRVLRAVDLSAVLTAADSKIDGSLSDRLRDGSVRLLRCNWLASPASDAFLGRDASGAVIMKRQQDMPEEAFVPCEEAVAMLERGDRSILALSYGWLTALHPDPHGTTLAAVRRFLDADAAASDTGLFWDFCSLPQKGPDGEDKTEAEKAMFGRGLKVMGNFYASVTGTSVIQQRSIDLPPGATTGFGPGDYNPTPYEGEGGRGWCIFEQGVNMTVLAHLTAAERQAGEEGKTLPERFRRAQASRAKVYDIGGEAPVARECSLPPRVVLDEACRAIAKARFTGKADRVMVPQMLAEFEWIVRSTFEQALEQHADSGVAIRPADLQAARGADKERRPGCDVVYTKAVRERACERERNHM